METYGNARRSNLLRKENVALEQNIMRNYPAPSGPKQMQRFLALGQYYGRYTEGYAKLVAPLRLLEKKKRWSKGDMAPGSAEHRLFLQIKDALTEDVRLALPNWSKPFVLKSDFSNIAMGGALLQEDDNGKLRPIAFVSRKCVGAETTASAPDGELLALVWAVQRFEKFLSGKRFKAYVDQESLHWLHDKNLCSINNKRLQSAFAYLRQFQFDLFYKKAKDMQDVDALSRAVAATTQGKTSETCFVDTEFDPADGEPEQDQRTAAVAAAVAAAKRKTRVKQAKEETGSNDGPGVAQVELEGIWGFRNEVDGRGLLTSRGRRSKTDPCN